MSDRREMIEAVVAKWSSDASFRESLLDDPESAIKALGLGDVRANDDECGGPDTCKSTCAMTCGDTCGALTCAVSL